MTADKASTPGPSAAYWRTQPCPACNAAIGENCRTTNNHKLVGSHYQRRDAVAQASLPEPSPSMGAVIVIRLPEYADEEINGQFRALAVRVASSARRLYPHAVGSIHTGQEAATILATVDEIFSADEGAETP